MSSYAPSFATTLTHQLRAQRQLGAHSCLRTAPAQLTAYLLTKLEARRFCIEIARYRLRTVRRDYFLSVSGVLEAAGVLEAVGTVLDAAGVSPAGAGAEVPLGLM